MNIEQDPNAVIDIAYIAVGRRSAAGSAQALSALSSTVTQQGVDISSSSSRVTSLENSVNSTSNGLATKASTKSLNSLSSTVTSQSNTQTAQARSITQLQSTVGEHTSQISQLANSTADSNGKISATYSVKLAAAQNGLQYVAGFGLSLDNNSGVFQSQFVVAADRFAVIRDVAGNVTSPFVIDNGQVFIADAVIGTASITNAKIANGAITTAKIGVAEIDTLRIRGNAVTIPTSASTSVVSQGSGIGSWIGVIAVAVTMDQPGHIQVNFSCTQSFGHGIRDYGFRLLINGGVYASFSGTWADGFPGIAYSLPVDAGTYVMQVDWYGQDANVSIANKNLFAMGAKR
ncbi:DUF1983 domain-containing protein [Pseudomonas sp. LP_7_YM]|uniref:phage tail tip fiber protein n=1 Tax=Pseudomonas sp. LP_7_YM TaxID=2485137 RepID=UPI0021150BE1|nr:DUF1983 domain-containing protein [Pseudomonas sp. LP_7_YM]